jgi:transcription initiation factor TFIIH subunit 4
MLDLFVNLKVRMPNMVQGVISRESIRKALTTGVKAQQILDFLK